MQNTDTDSHTTGRCNACSSFDERIADESKCACEVGRNLKALCVDIGPRFAGTEGYRCAADVMLDRFKSYGLVDAHLEGFEFTAWRRGKPASLSFIKPTPNTFECYALPYSAPTGSGGLHGRIVDVGKGLAEELDSHKDALAGNIALTLGTGRHRHDVYEHSVALGAAGLIICNTTPGGAFRTGSVTNATPGAIPCVSLGREAGQLVKGLAHKVPDTEFVLTTDCGYEPATTWNVVGELVGNEYPDELVVIGGHLDSHEIGPGAYDNAAGAVMVMEVARLLARCHLHLKRTVRFIGFAGEEIGLVGSAYHAKAHEAQLTRIRTLCNCDMPPVSGPWSLNFYGCHDEESRRRYTHALGQQMGLTLDYKTFHHEHSDHAAFVRRGVPAFALGGGREGLTTGGTCHMAGDTADHIPVKGLCEASAVAARVLLRTVNDELWPDRHSNP